MEKEIILHRLPAAEFRPYREEDYEAVCGFLMALNRKDKKHINWNWARFEWMMEHPEFDKSAIRSIGLWWEQERIIGAAIYDMYYGEAFCSVLPEYEELYPVILDYAYVEPVCTVPAHRGKGLASALLSEALTRAKILGAGEAYVISDLPFYEKLGFEKAQHFTFYRKKGGFLTDKREK